MPIKNIAGYLFIELNDLSSLRERLYDDCQVLEIKGTILLSREGINLNLAGQPAAVDRFITKFKADKRFEELVLKSSYSGSIPFKRLKVKLKKEIISLRQKEADPLAFRAPAISPETFKDWLDKNKDITILDTRNDYEIRFGTFEDAQNLHIDNFCEFPSTLDKIEKDKPLVMFCTGGVRCEKAAIYLLKHGIKDVYQLDGGILNYFEKTGGAHYQGDCYVFDERVALNNRLQPSGKLQCQLCQGPISPGETCACNAKEACL